MRGVVDVNDYRKVEKCSKCGGAMVFRGVGEYRCESCGNVEYDDYGIVRNYIEKNKGATVVEISVATGISQSTINRMLREERLQVSSSSRVFLKCRSCGKDITIGEYCPACEKLAEAAERRKNARKHNFAGYGSTGFTGESGAKRFRRGEK